ncbi:reverse transcriptase, partial [Operophtera brumata]
LILNLKNLNFYVHNPKFRLISLRKVSQTIQKGDYMVKIDISNAYYHVPVWDSHRRYLSFAFGKNIYNMNCLPFGLSSAPSVFSKISNWVASLLREKGIRTIVYLDDFLLLNKDAILLAQQAQWAVGFLQDLGWHINLSKTNLTPTPKIEYLGLSWDSTENKKSLPYLKIANIRGIITQTLNKNSWSWQSAKQLLGKLSFASNTVPLGALHCRSIQIAAKQLPDSQRNKMLQLPNVVRQELSWWSQNVSKSSTLQVATPSAFVTTDASDIGWGATVNGKKLSGHWDTYQDLWHSNQKEFLENTGWAAEVMDWNETERKVLQSAWRPSTLRTYKPAWESWLQWAKNEDISPSTPDPKDLARYLIHLHQVRKLAPRTVLVHKSVVATFTNPSKDSLSNHPIVKKVIKAIMLKNPPSHSLSTWDVADFLKWVSGRNVEVSNLFQVSQHVATLLLLATGRRIHDLTLLHIDSDRCHITRDKIIIWPAFGSKTDNAKYRQSGWCLSKNDDLKLDLCYWIPILVEATKLRRGADSTLTNMFITTRGKVKAASKSIIAGWLRHTFKNANIKCSPGSFRSAVATNNWSKKNLNLDEVLRKDCKLKTAANVTASNFLTHKAANTLVCK